MRYVIVDLEATCWEKNTTLDRMEIIEIGAVVPDFATDRIDTEFVRFVRPVDEPVLSEFCRQLTGIRQCDVDSAATFDVVFPEFVDWIGPEPFTLCSWGAYDVKQFRFDCGRHDVAMPETFERHINLKTEFATQRDMKPCSMKRALKLAGFTLDGNHHRALDDARNIAKLAKNILAECSINVELDSSNEL